MKIHLKFFIILHVSALLASCASVSESIYIDSANQFQNESERAIHNSDYSPGFMYRLMNTGLKIGGVKKIFMDSPESVIKRSNSFNKRLQRHPPKRFYNNGNIHIQEINMDGNPCFVISPSSNPNTEKVLVYLHGGGFVLNIQSFHWKIINRFVNELKIPVIAVLYPLYPETNPEKIMSAVNSAFSFAYDAFPEAKVIGAGDSAGAYLLLSYCHYLTHTNAEIFPDRLICMSPPQVIGIDEETLDAMKIIDKKDPMLSVDVLKTLPALYNLKPDEFNWFTAPLFGDFRKFPPMSVFIGTNEIFYPLIPVFAERVRSQGKEIDLYIGNEMMHVWPLLPKSREAKYATDIILDIIKLN